MNKSLSSRTLGLHSGGKSTKELKHKAEHNALEKRTTHH